MTFRIALAAAGTGGHFYPGLAVLESLRTRFALKGRSVEAMFIGTARGIEARVVPTLGEGNAVSLVDILPINGVPWRDKLRAMWRLPGALFRCVQSLRRFRPHVVLSVGGYTAGPVAAAAIIMRIPCAIIEPNAVPGLTHRIVGKAAQRAFITHEQTRRFFRASAVRVIGTPVRQAFIQSVGRSEAPAAQPSEAETRPLNILVVGGSQGARAINKLLPATICRLANEGLSLRFTHQTGRKEYDDVRAAYAREVIPEGYVEVVPYIDDVAAAMSRADVLVCRAGASTVAEVGVVGVPAVYIPLPTAADDHQRHNAMAMQQSGAALCLEQQSLTPEKLSETIRMLVEDTARRHAMATNARRCGRPGSSDDVAAELISLTNS